MSRYFLTMAFFVLAATGVVFGAGVVDKSDMAIVPGADPTLGISAKSLGVLEEHFKAYLAYTENQMTPGYKEFSFANRWRNGELEGIKFFRLGQGPPIETGNTLDLMIEGKVFFVIEGPWGIGYTRDGRMEIDTKNRLVTFANRFVVLGENGPIHLKSRDIFVSRSGEVFDGDNLIDVLRVVQFDDLRYVDSFNSNIFYYEGDDPEFVEDPQYFIRQGYYEGSAVVKGLIGEVPRFKHVYEAGTLVIRRVIKGYQAALTIGSP